MSNRACITPTLVSTTLDACIAIDDGRRHPQVALHALSELGELAIEVKIATGHGGRRAAGEDGVVGEAIDLILCVIDFMHRLDPGVDDARFISGLSCRPLGENPDFLKFVDKECVGQRLWNGDDRTELMMSIAVDAGRLCGLGEAPEADEIDEAYAPAARIIRNCLFLIRHEAGKLVESDLVALAKRKLDKWKAGATPRPTFSQHLTEEI